MKVLPVIVSRTRGNQKGKERRKEKYSGWDIVDASGYDAKPV